MEFEIQDEGEDVLFDASTNPSLRPGDKADAKRKLQTAELFPEEEELLAQVA